MQTDSQSPSDSALASVSGSAARRVRQAKLHLYKAAMLAEDGERGEDAVQLYWHIRNALAALNDDSYTVEQCR